MRIEKIKKQTKFIVAYVFVSSETQEPINMAFLRKTNGVLVDRTRTYKAEFINVPKVGDIVELSDVSLEFRQGDESWED